MNAAFKDDPDHIIFELQLVHKKLMFARQGMNGHDDYAVYRVAMEMRSLLDQQSLEKPSLRRSVSGKQIFGNGNGQDNNADSTANRTMESDSEMGFASEDDVDSDSNGGGAIDRPPLGPTAK